MGSLKGSTASLKLQHQGLERWSNSQEHPSLFQRTQVQFPGFIGLLTTVIAVPGYQTPSRTYTQTYIQANTNQCT